MMSEQSPPENEYDALYVRKSLDEVLAQEITLLIDIDSGTAQGVYNLTTLACIIIAVEREREIKNFPDFPPERYTRQSFIAELAEIGINSEEELDHSVSSVVEMGYLHFIEGGDLQAEASAYTMAGFLNTMFPGMQGMNLIAFVMQMNDEVVSGRKSLELAKKSFVQTLKSRGVAVTREKAEAKAREIAEGPPVSSVSSISPESRAISRQLKENAAIRIAALRSKRSSSKPSIYSSIGHGADRSKVKDVFGKGPSKEDLAAERAALEAAEKEKQEAEKRARELAKIEARFQETEERTRALEAREQSLKQAQNAVHNAEQEARRLMESEAASVAEKKAELQAMEKKIRAAEQELLLEKEALGQALLEKKMAEEQAEVDEFEPESEEDLESKIAAFEAELAMPCPLCQEGKIVSETTAKDKTYYTCSSKECRFVSWEKPYHFQCPLCKNPFLTEIVTPTGEKGLKCPRASCSYFQNNLLDPVHSQAAQANPLKKKKKLVRRVKRR